jgi:hypothetical protein
MLGVRPSVDPADNKQKGQSWGFLLAGQIHLQNAIVVEHNVVNCDCVTTLESVIKS